VTHYPSLSNKKLPIFAFLLVLLNMYSVYVYQGMKQERDLYRKVYSTCVEKDSQKEILAKYLVEHAPHITRAYASTLADAYIEAGKEYQVSPWLLVSISIPESNLNSMAISEAGAVGIMQIMPKYWVGIVPFLESEDDLYNTRTNIRAGAYIIRYYISTCGGLKEGISCYHGGPRSLQAPRASTVSYVQTVLRRYYKSYSL
jgi:soluble lytic murein transglycosylase-like protein